MITSHRMARISLVAGAAVLAASPAMPQEGAAPVARYTVDAGTMSGMAAMGAGGGVGAALGMLRGGGGQVAHELVLRLGSSQAASGEPDADHFMPDGARLGRSVPLVTPRQVRNEPTAPGMPQGQMQMPQGRLLLFWGCGEHAPAGQPVIIDFSKMARGEVPPGLFAQAVSLPEDWRISASNSRTYGEWPNERDAKTVPANSSLLGAHRVAGNYSPEIAFNLADDFMPALRAASRDIASGAVSLSWNALPKATGYYAWAMATNPEGNSRDMVWWSSSSTQQFAGALADWLSPAAVRRLVDAGTVLPPSQTTCTIPAEVKQAGGPMLMTYLYGYGPQADFAYPPRPDNTRTPWKPEWIARVRFRSSTMLMHGMPGMGGFEAGADRAEAPAEQQPAAKPKCRGGLRGIAERAAGLCE